MSIDNNLKENIPNYMMNEIIKNGDLIWVKVTPESEWICDAVDNISVQKNNIEIFLVEELLMQDTMVGDAVQCRVIQNEAEYILECRVQDIGIVNPQKVILSVVDIKKYDNIRACERYTVNLCGKIIFNNSERATFATVKNISKTGVSITCREQISLGEEVDIDIILWQREVISIEGKIMRMVKIDKNYKYGVFIESIDKRSREMLIEFIEELDKKQKETGRDLD